MIYIVGIALYPAIIGAVLRWGADSRDSLDWHAHDVGPRSR